MLVWLYSECNWIAAWTSALSLMLKVQTARFLLFHWVVQYLEHVDLSSQIPDTTYCFESRMVQGQMTDLLWFSAQDVFWPLFFHARFFIIFKFSSTSNFLAIGDIINSWRLCLTGIHICPDSWAQLTAVWLIQPQASRAYIKLKWISDLLFWPISSSLQRYFIDT